jgi:hypothetical protein
VPRWTKPIRRSPNVHFEQRTLDNLLKFQTVHAFDHASATLCRVKPFC